jgi:hypothetical protein
MGLTVHFSLLLPSALTPDEATGRIAALHQAVATLPMRSQTAMVLLDEARIQHALSERSRSPWRWAVIQYQRGLSYRHDHLGIPHQVDRGESGVATYHRMLLAKRLVGFTCLPGEGCEPINLFIGAYPASTMVDCTGNQHGYPSGKRRLMLPKTHWLGSAFCKTQYASLPEAGGVTNFLRCHLLVIAALDAAKAAGFEVLVTDEGGYWQHRCIPRLVREIADWNAFLLSIGDQLRARIGQQVQCAITPERAAAPVDPAVAIALGDDVLDLIQRTKGSTVELEAAAAPAAAGA